MRERERSKEGTTPGKTAETTPQAYTSGDYTYTVELVASINLQIGRLTEAVETLKTETQSHGTKLDEIGRKIHAAEVTVRVVTVILAGVIAFGAWAITKAVDVFVKLQSPPVLTTPSTQK